VIKFSKYRGVSQKRWCVLTGKRVYFFESFSASKYSAPTEVIPWSRVLFVRYACSSPEKRILTVCCKSRLLGIRSVHVDLFGGGDDMDSTWCECFAKLPSVSFFAALEKPKRADISAPLSAGKPASVASDTSYERRWTACAKVSDSVDGLSRTSTISTRGSGMRRVPKMSQIASRVGERAALSVMSSDHSSWHERDDTDSIASDSIASAAFIEDPDISRFPLTFRYGKESSSADLCASYQLAKTAPSISTMDSETGLGAECDASSSLPSEIGDNFSDVLSDGILTRVEGM
jgi:hypothetical protein